MPLIAPSPDLSDGAELNGLMLPFCIATILSRAGFRTVGEIRKASDIELLKHPRLSRIGITYFRKRLGGLPVNGAPAVMEASRD